MTIPIPELVAPAASFAKAKAAFDFGADAVYVGLERYSLRAHAGTFTIEGLEQLLEYSRETGRRVYVALNAMPDERRCREIQELLGRLALAGCTPDALIVSDPGVLSLCRRIVSAIPVHLSTQTGTFNSDALSFWKEHGVSRAVLPRELSLEQIAELCGCDIMPLEVFIHGAMCMSVSGRCLMGAYLQGRHPNHGDCHQPCRLSYRVSSYQSSDDEGSDLMTIEETRDGVSIFNAKDLCTIGILDRIVASGVCAVKIEGRNRSINYIASVVRTYRAALDVIALGKPYRVCEEWRRELEFLEHRSYTTGFYAGELALQDPHNTRHSAQADIVGIVRERLRNGACVVEVKHPFAIGDRLDLLPCDQIRSPSELRIDEMMDLNGMVLTRAVTHRLARVRTQCHVRPGDILRRMRSS